MATAKISSAGLAEAKAILAALSKSPTILPTATAGRIRKAIAPAGALCRWRDSEQSDGVLTLLNDLVGLKGSERRGGGLLRQHPSHRVTAWLGHSEDVCVKHYLMTTDEDFPRALAGAEGNCNPTIGGNLTEATSEDNA